ncbi:3-phosphoshikimate 1-carboxyvinyltransferase, partial [Candidatus Woesearchaeota archaeon]|nr:3-phosphoshikimate 1-carboxyvinyltransferase [Candidatus Woesearchaeota archaeon]
MIEIKPIKKLDAAVSVPGSKYTANRLLIICALADGTSILKNVPENEDVKNAISALEQFGIEIKRNNDELIIRGTNGKLTAPKNEINVGDSGTLLRFISGFAALAKGKTTITGSRRIQQRPILDLLNSLNDLGIKSISQNGNAPLEILGGNLKGGKTKIKGNISSQFISSLLMVAPFAKKDVEINVEGKLVSSEYVDLTIKLMRDSGIKVERKNKAFKIKSNQKYKPKIFTIPSDWASANYFLAAAAIVPGTIKVENLEMQSSQPESGFIDLLVRMGCKVSISENSLQITGNNKLKSIDADMGSMPDSAQTLAAVALFADGVTKIKNIKNLKFKESDRINDTADELRKLGADVEAKNNEIIINNKKKKSKLNPALIDSHNDHRMAMSFAVAGLKIGMKIKNPECISKSFPQFLDKLKEIGTEVKEPKNIVLIGYRGAGKTSISTELSKLTGMPAISTDNEISKKVKMPIADFIEKYGWKKFRQAESEIIKTLENHYGAIIDCGGGVVEDSENISILKKNGTVFWLKAPAKTLAARIKQTKNRPSITVKKSFTDEIEEVLQRRIPLYKQAADFELETSDKKPSEAAKLIMKIIDEFDNNKTKNKMMKTEICAVITANNAKDALEEMKSASSADLIELRLDFIKSINKNDVKNLLKNKAKNVIVACRPVKFGGLFKGNEKDRLELLKTAVENEADFIDVEFGSEIAGELLKSRKTSKIIISHHDFEKTPPSEDLNLIYKNIQKSSPDLIKIVTTANSINDNF